MYKLRAYVKVIATGVTGRVEQRNQSTGKYWVEFDRNLNSRQWFAESELAGVSRALFFLRCHSAKLFHGAALGIALAFSSIYSTGTNTLQAGPVSIQTLKRNVYVYVLAGSTANGSVQLLGPKIVWGVF